MTGFKLCSVLCYKPWGLQTVICTETISEAFSAWEGCSLTVIRPVWKKQQHCNKIWIHWMFKIPKFVLSLHLIYRLPLVFASAHVCGFCFMSHEKTHTKMDFFKKTKVVCGFPVWGAVIKWKISLRLCSFALVGYKCSAQLRLYPLAATYVSISYAQVAMPIPIWSRVCGF